MRVRYKHSEQLGFGFSFRHKKNRTELCPWCPCSLKIGETVFPPAQWCRRHWKQQSHLTIYSWRQHALCPIGLALESPSSNSMPVTLLCHSRRKFLQSTRSNVIKQRQNEGNKTIMISINVDERQRDAARACTSARLRRRTSLTSRHLSSSNTLLCRLLMHKPRCIGASPRVYVSSIMSCLKRVVCLM